MKLYALDTVHVSSVKPDALVRGEEFEVKDGEGAQLVARGLAAEDAPTAKSAPARSTKVEPPVKNKSA